MTRAFVTYVRPLLEYASCVWSPYLLKHIKRIESVQKRFTKRLSSISFGYTDRLKAIGLEFRELRRLHHDLLCTYKSNQIKSNIFLFKKMQNNTI